MDDGDLDFSNPETYLCPSLGGADAPAGCSMDRYFDEILKDTEHLACTHTHTCNPPANDLSHTHTCVHVHTKVVSASSDGGAESPSGSGAASKKRRPSGNRAAVLKYQEKKKAHTALLEEEVVHLKALNKQLMQKVQSHAALEAEVARLRLRRRNDANFRLQMLYINKKGSRNDEVVEEEEEGSPMHRHDHLKTVYISGFRLYRAQKEAGVLYLGECSSS